MATWGVATWVGAVACQGCGRVALGLWDVEWDCVARLVQTAPRAPHEQTQAARTPSPCRLESIPWDDSS